MTIESEFFKIEPLYNSGYGDTRYVVSWPNRGMVSKESSVMSIWRFAFDTGAFQVGFANSHDCLWVDAIVDMQAPECDAYMVIKRLGEIDRVVFPKESHAEAFVYSLEKQITFKLLSRDYDD